jgi:MerR family transcriptional regulator/heat shock protein HspR
MHGRPERDPERPVYVISVAATLVSAHPRTLRIYEDEGLLCPARTPTNIRLYSENDIRRLTWIRHLTRERGVNLAGIRILFELEERLGARILEALYAEGTGDAESTARSARPATAGTGTADPAASQPTPPPAPSPASADEPNEPTTRPSADRTPASSTVGDS